MIRILYNKIVLFYRDNLKLFIFIIDFYNFLSTLLLILWWWRTHDSLNELGNMKIK